MASPISDEMWRAAARRRLVSARSARRCEDSFGPHRFFYNCNSNHDHTSSSTTTTTTTSYIAAFIATTTAT